MTTIHLCTLRASFRGVIIYMNEKTASNQIVIRLQKNSGLGSILITTSVAIPVRLIKSTAQHLHQPVMPLRWSPPTLDCRGR
jgi:hypothetical protein